MGRNTAHSQRTFSSTSGIRSSSNRDPVTQFPKRKSEDQ
jgi:hypothetical protein